MAVNQFLHRTSEEVIQTKKKKKQTKKKKNSKINKETKSKELLTIKNTNK